MLLGTGDDAGREADQPLSQTYNHDCMIGALLWTEIV